MAKSYHPKKVPASKLYAWQFILAVYLSKLYAWQFIYGKLYAWQFILAVYLSKLYAWQFIYGSLFRKVITTAEMRLHNKSLMWSRFI
jgi:hypothetical protein